MPPKMSFCPQCTAWQNAYAVGRAGYLKPTLDSIARQDQDDGSLPPPPEIINVGISQLHEPVEAAADDVESLPRNADDDRSISTWSSVEDPPPHGLTDVVRNAETCPLCSRIWLAFEEWAREQYGSVDNLDLSTSVVSGGGISLGRLPDDGEQSDDSILYEEDGIHGELYIFYIRVAVRDPMNPGRWREPRMAFQKSRAQAPSVDDIFVGIGAEDPRVWPHNEPYIARRRPLVADPRLFRKWKGLCQATHGPRCRQEWTTSNAPALCSIRLIDVERLCLIEVENVGSVSWVALSYVWGSVPFCTLTKDTLDGAKRDGALGASWVPATIADAITVTRGLGERYLWTDSLCILQDSEADKMLFVPHMDVIYNHSVLTIIVAAGDNAFSGLPGVRPGTRFREEVPFAILGTTANNDYADANADVDDSVTWLVRAHEPMRSGAETLGDSHWFSRGWTFQEAMLSQRCLIFGPERVYWECRQATWREDGCWEPIAPSPSPPDDVAPKPTVIYESVFAEIDLRRLWSGLESTSHFDTTYKTLVSNYTKRTLTHDSDSLQALTGLLRALTQLSGEEFLWGLPRRFFGVAITWPSGRERLRRRADQCWIESPSEKGGGDSGGRGGTMVQANFPTWSWVGWAGEVDFEACCFGNLDGEHPSLEFYHVVEGQADDGNAGRELSLRYISQNQVFRHKEFGVPGYSELIRGTNYQWRGDTSIPIHVDDIPATLLRPETRFSLLAVWTSIAVLYLEHKANKPGRKRGTSRSRIYRLWTQENTLIDAFWDQYPPPPPPPAKPQEDIGAVRERAEFVVVGRDSVERARKRGQLSVFFVKRHVSGGLFRVAHASIWEDEWNEVKNRRWEMVFLV